ncbi:MAG TPA: nuclear transport factor 2 family protein [Pyrinomonadaceae bacterium]|nr:nuclear transport factor 2 family protein [Pyrinomonadaceae bacterium]
MRKFYSMAIALVIVIGGLSLFAARRAAADPSQQDIANQIIARERASTEAWQNKNKSFFAEYLADDATFFASQNPYLETDPKVNFLPKFDTYVEQFKIIDWQMFNPRVQVYGDTAILTYNQAATVNLGGRVLNYTGKVTSVYVKQGNTWRVVHAHESMNPGAQ